jgi:membrane-associated phospholipid phosphatase
VTKPSLPSADALPPPPTEPLGEAVARGLHLPRPWRERVRAFDDGVDSAFDKVRGNPVVDRVFYAASELGDMALVWHLISVARGLRSDEHAKDAVRLSAVLGVESVLVNGVVKSFFRRTRPTWDQPRAYRIRRPRSSSFPSGHASSAFTAAGVLSEHDELWPLYYAIAAAVAASRVYVKIHHASDVVAGVATGIVLGRLARKVWPSPVHGQARREHR